MTGVDLAMGFVNVGGQFFGVGVELRDGLTQNGGPINIQVVGDLIEDLDLVFRRLVRDDLGTHIRKISLRITLRNALQSTGNLVSRQVVVEDEDGEHDEADERELVDTLFDLLVQVAAHKAFDGEEKDHAAVEDGDRKQVEDAQL
jgi:hypothetical protein